MRILASVIHSRIFFVEIDLHTGHQWYHLIQPEFIDETVPVRPCRPFGITWDRSYLYVVNNRRIHRFTTDLAFLDTIVGTLPPNSHQMIKAGDAIYVASTQVDSIARVTESSLIYYDLLTEEWLETPTYKNNHHVNSLLRVGDILYVNIHGRLTGSHIRAYDFPSLACYEIPQFGGLQTHNIGFNNMLYTLDTGRRKLRCGTDEIPLDSRYLRGLCLTTDDFVVGDAFWDRANRGQDSRLLWYDADLKLRKAMIVPGEICDIRLLDEFDYAHHIAILGARTDHSDISP